MMINKVISYNPRLIKKISLKKASVDYLDYIFIHFDKRYMNGDKRCKMINEQRFDDLGIKDFKTWLSTEI